MHEEPGYIDTPVLNKLGASRVFRIYPRGDLYEFREGCDDHFSVKLTRDQVLALADELRRMTQDP